MPSDEAKDPEDSATDVRLVPKAPGVVEGRAFVLEVIEGPDAGLQKTIEPTDPSRLLIGLSSACELRLTDRLVSRRHAAVEAVGERLRWTDLGSTSGTSVGGVAVVEAFLRGGEIVRLGDTTVRVSRPQATEAPPLTTAMRFGGVIGGSPEMRRLYPLCERLAATDVPVLIEGETGTGKGQLAEALHEGGPRARGPFVVFDCTAVAPNLLESALFGHERGAYPGAVASRRGVFELAEQGTLLLDEIGELELSLQPKLLRAIEQREIQRVGAHRWTLCDVRVISATRRNLDREVQAGRFRDDLFFRLAVARIELPPLRRRSGDVGLLARHFWRAFGGEGSLSDDFVQRLEAYEWPGNVRELHNVVARRISLGEHAPIETAGQTVPPKG